MYTNNSNSRFHFCNKNYTAIVVTEVVSSKMVAVLVVVK